ncbi:hypothetical protein [Pseudoalteromonas umbrosa]|uniref:hypothetical protein n=1 Tax=Pseudoalteromonas umbrosa TaxID=3048489 RepID=UPI0024C43DF8|nr:hypothetical protein [Pseudoalteromonas sp. B95]MDK1290163.1 hypothetical protein [Pseudoalteromonas sp. B95]
MIYNNTLASNEHFVMIAVVPQGASPKSLSIEQQKARWQAVESTADFIRDKVFEDKPLMASTHIEREIKPRQYGILLTINGDEKKLTTLLKEAARIAKHSGINIVSNLLTPDT